VQFRILGPLEVGNGQGDVSVDTPKLRALLGVLLLHPNEVVSSERLIDELWGERPPATAPKLVQTYVSQLRRELGPGAIETRAPGYLVPVVEEDLDAACFRRLAAEARRLAADGEQERARRVYREALALWRGPPLADVLFQSFARNEVERLEEERLSLRMDLIDCELAVGRHAEVVPEVEELVRQYPLRERLRAQLMLGLYRSARQADALAAYQDARRTLVEELGLEPGRELQDLEKAILTHDSALEAPPRRDALHQARGWPVTRRRAGALAAAVALTLALVLAFALGGRGQRPMRLVPNSVGFIDAKSGRVTRSFPVGRLPRALAVGFDSVWAANFRDGTVTRIPRAGGDPVTIPVGGHPTAIVATRRAVWAWTLEGLLVPIDPRFSTPGSAIHLPAQTMTGGPGGIAAGGGFLWVTEPPTTVIRVDPSGRRADPQIPDAGAQGPVVFGAGKAWVAGSDQVFPIDARTSIPGPGMTVGTARGIAFAGRDLWVVSGGPGHVGGVVQALRPVDLESGLPGTPIDVGSDPRAVASAAGSIWAASRSDGTVSRVDPAEDRVLATIPLGASPTALAADRDGVWVAVE